MIENKKKIFGLSPHNKCGDVFGDSNENESKPEPTEEISVDILDVFTIEYA